MQIAGLLLAAGAGERFGGCKQLASINGKPLINHSLDALSPVLGENLFVVLGAYADDVRAAVESSAANVIINHNWRRGLGSSIACGVSEVIKKNNWDGVMIALADQVLLSDQDYQALLDQYGGKHIVAASYAGQVGVPAIFPPSLFDQLTQLDGDRGAKSIVNKLLHDAVTIPLESAAFDIDSADDIS